MIIGCSSIRGPCGNGQWRLWGLPWAFSHLTRAKPQTRVQRRRAPWPADGAALLGRLYLPAWADHLIKGLPAVGFAPNYGVFPEQDAHFLSLDDVLEDADANNASILNILGGLRPGKDDTFVLEQSCQDAEHGFCSQPMNKTALLSVLKGRRFRLIPRCVITQAYGKQRIIDDAARGRQSDLSSDRNKLVLCSPLRPAQHVAAVSAAASDAQWQAWMRSDRWLGAGEDLPTSNPQVRDLFDLASTHWDFHG